MFEAICKWLSSKIGHLSILFSEINYLKQQKIPTVS